MAWLKIYEWEYDTWPEFQTMKIDRREQEKYLGKLSRHFKVEQPIIIACRKRGANANSQDRGAAGVYLSPGIYWPARVKLGKVSTLGTVAHEFAHHLTFRRWGRRHGHDRKFKRELKRVYTWAKRYLPTANKEKNHE